jgi:hypothetical protein
MKDLAFRIHGLSKKVENLPLVNRATILSSTTVALTLATAVTTAPMAATTVTTTGLRHYSRNKIYTKQ